MMVKKGQSISLPKAKVSIQSFSWWSIRRSWQIRPSLRQMFLERRGVSPGMFLLTHSWTDCSYFMQILSAFSSRPRCSFTPNKTRTLFFFVCTRMGLNQSPDLEPFTTSNLDSWRAETGMSKKQPHEGMHMSLRFMALHCMAITATQ